jgi:hypothetical protein
LQGVVVVKKLAMEISSLQKQRVATFHCASFKEFIQIEITDTMR